MDMQVYNLAKRFVEELRNVYLDDDQIAEVNRRNAAEANQNICHSHDFCDANQAMIDALGGEYDNSDRQRTLISSAWKQAQDWGFAVPQ